MSALCVITARGGSKRIPRKNIRDFCGKPIIAYSIAAALESGLFEEVMVSTDDDEIAAISRFYGAEVPFMRSAETSNDYATTRDVLLEVLEEYRKRKRHFDVLCCIYPTAPFVTCEKLQNAASLLKESDADAIVPIVQYGFPPQRSIVIANNHLVYYDEKYASARSQDLAPMYHDVGQFYFYKTSAFLRSEVMLEGRAVGLVVSEIEVQDIDNHEDWIIAELKYELMTRLNNERIEAKE